MLDSCQKTGLKPTPGVQHEHPAPSLQFFDSLFPIPDYVDVSLKDR